MLPGPFSEPSHLAWDKQFLSYLLETEPFDTKVSIR
jgi:hypothetical protein